MTNAEVESTLREIRERARAEVGAAARGAHEPARAASEPARADGDGGDGPRADSLARLDVNLATAERAWNRLPPLVSNRTGWVARLELWVKRKIKRAAHWFTWEQVNFNSAVYQSLLDTRAALEDSQRRLAELRAALEAALGAESEARARSDAEIEARLAASEARSEARLAASEARLASAVASSEARAAEGLRSTAAALERRLDATDARLGATDARLDAGDARHGANEARLSETAEALRQESAAASEALRAELRERVEHVLEEQRVSLRQLALEAGERAVMHERARRRVEQRLEEISKAVISDK